MTHSAPKRGIRRILAELLYRVIDVLARIAWLLEEG